MCFFLFKCHTSFSNTCRMRGSVSTIRDMSRQRPATTGQVHGLVIGQWGKNMGFLSHFSGNTWRVVYEVLQKKLSPVQKLCSQCGACPVLSGLCALCRFSVLSVLAVCRSTGYPCWVCWLWAPYRLSVLSVLAVGPRTGYPCGVECALCRFSVLSVLAVSPVQAIRVECAGCGPHTGYPCWVCWLWAPYRLSVLSVLAVGPRTGYPCGVECALCRFSVLSVLAVSPVQAIRVECAGCGPHTGYPCWVCCLWAPYRLFVLSVLAVGPIQAIRALEECHLQDEEEEKDQQKMLLRLYLDAAVCNLRLRQSGKVVSLCNQALALGESCVKAFYLKGKVRAVWRPSTWRARWELCEGLLPQGQGESCVKAFYLKGKVRAVWGPSTWRARWELCEGLLPEGQGESCVRAFYLKGKVRAVWRPSTSRARWELCEGLPQGQGESCVKAFYLKGKVGGSPACCSRLNYHTPVWPVMGGRNAVTLFWKIMMSFWIFVVIVSTGYSIMYTIDRNQC